MSHKKEIPPKGGVFETLSLLNNICPAPDKNYATAQEMQLEYQHSLKKMKTYSL